MDKLLPVEGTDKQLPIERKRRERLDRFRSKFRPSIFTLECCDGASVRLRTFGGTSPIVCLLDEMADRETFSHHDWMSEGHEYKRYPYQILVRPRVLLGTKE